MLDTERGDSLEMFLQRLTDTMDWCAPRASLADPRFCLRTPWLAPDPLAGSRKHVVRSVAQRRHAALGWPKALVASGLQGGRLFAYEPDRNLADGAAELETREFLDGLNVPPWDTWIAYIHEDEGYLVAWIPPVFAETVDAGIRVNPEESIWWVDVRKTILGEQLRGRGLLPSLTGR